MPPIALRTALLSVVSHLPCSCVPKTVHPIGIEYLVGRRRTGSGLRAATRPRRRRVPPVMLAACWNAINREFQTAEAAEQRGAQPNDPTPEPGLGSSSGRPVLSVAASRARKIRRRLLGQSEGGPGYSQNGASSGRQRGRTNFARRRGGYRLQRSWTLSCGL